MGPTNSKFAENWTCLIWRGPLFIECCWQTITKEWTSTLYIKILWTTNPTSPSPSLKPGPNKADYLPAQGWESIWVDKHHAAQYKWKLVNYLEKLSRLKLYGNQWECFRAAGQTSQEGYPDTLRNPYPLLDQCSAAFRNPILDWHFNKVFHSSIRCQKHLPYPNHSQLLVQPRFVLFEVRESQKFVTPCFALLGVKTRGGGKGECWHWNKEILTWRKQVEMYRATKFKHTKV